MISWMPVLAKPSIRVQRESQAMPALKRDSSAAPHLYQYSEENAHKNALL